MYKVLIVDDERIIRIALKSMIRWEDQGFCADYIAEDGVVALDLVEKHHPHLLIVDIMMPNMDGIEFVKTVRSRGYSGEIIILSNHQDFRYAVEALRNRVSDYIMKTDITPQTLTQCLARIKCRLDESAPFHTFQTDLSSAEDDLALLRDILAKPDIAETDNKILSRPYVFLNVFIRLKNKSKNNIPQNAFRNLAIESVQELGYSVLPFTPESILLVIPQQSLSDCPPEAIAALAEKIGRSVRLYLNTESGFVLSSPFNDSRQFVEKIHALADAEQLVLYKNFGTIIKEDDYAPYIDKPVDPRPIINQLKEFMDHGDYRGCKSSFKTAVLQLKEKKVQPRHTIQLMSKVFEFTLLHNTVCLASAKIQVNELSQQFQHSCTLEQYILNFNNLMDTVSSRRLRVSNVSYREEITKIDQYVQQNIHRKITLSMIAQAINLSENYISRMFKAETGVNIVTYINQFKMERAKLLLETPNTSVGEIALSLGFDETPYFIKLFHKFYGVSPTEYRKMVLDKIKL